MIAFIASVRRYRFAGGCGWPCVGTGSCPSLSLSLSLFSLSLTFSLSSPSTSISSVGCRVGPAEFVPVAPLASAASWRIFSCRLSKNGMSKKIEISGVSAYPKQEQSFPILLLPWQTQLEPAPAAVSRVLPVALLGEQGDRERWYVL
jgi:hypothetical protein